MSGTTELKTKRLLLRRHTSADAETLYKQFGQDAEMFTFTGWNPYATPEMARDSVAQFIDSYSDEYFYGWAIEMDGQLIGTIGAYDYDAADDSIEVGFSIMRSHWGHGYAAEALRRVLTYLTDEEGVSTVTAWCASGNIGSQKTLEKAGMHLVSTEKAALHIDDHLYDKLTYRYGKSPQDS